jgi:flagellar biosynthetic protein FliR
MTGAIPNLYQFPEGQIIAFALVLMRIIAFFVAWPVFGSNQVPVHVKVLLSITVAMMMFPTVKLQNADLLRISEDVILLTAREIVIGLTLGFVMKMFFFSISIGGEIMSVTTGLSAAQLFNPAMGGSSTVIEQLELVLATLFFLGINGHHLFISGLASSFEMLPVSDTGFNFKAYAGFAMVAQTSLLMGLKMAAPVMIASFLTNLTMGVLGRAVPQINVLVTSMPVTILIGIGVLFVTLPLMVLQMNGLLDLMADQFFKMMKVL